MLSIQWALIHQIMLKWWRSVVTRASIMCCVVECTFCMLKSWFRRLDCCGGVNLYGDGKVFRITGACWTLQTDLKFRMRNYDMRIVFRLCFLGHYLIYSSLHETWCSVCKWHYLIMFQSFKCFFVHDYLCYQCFANARFKQLYVNI